MRPDRLTAYEAIKGREYSGVMLKFGSVVLFKASAKVSGGIMEPRWRRGIWLGKRFATEEHVMGTPDGGVIRSRAVKPHPEQQWNTELFDNLRGVPWDPSGKAVASEASTEHTADLSKFSVARSVEPTIPQARRVMISRAYLERFNFTERCFKCDAMQSGDNSKLTLAHSSACRARIEARLAAGPLLSKHLDNANRRQDEYFAKRIEAGDTSAKRVHVSQDEEVELQPSPGEASEVRVESIDGENMSEIPSEGCVLGLQVQ